MVKARSWHTTARLISDLPSPQRKSSLSIGSLYKAREVSPFPLASYHTHFFDFHNLHRNLDPHTSLHLSTKLPIIDALRSLFCYIASWPLTLFHALIKSMIAMLPFEPPTAASPQSLRHHLIHWLVKVERDRTFMILLSIFLLIASLLAYVQFVVYLYEKRYLADLEEYGDQWLQGRSHEFGYSTPPNQPHPLARAASMPAPGPSPGGYLARNHTNSQTPPGMAQQSRAASLPPFPSDGSIHNNSSRFHRYLRSPSVSPESSHHRSEVEVSAQTKATPRRRSGRRFKGWNSEKWGPTPDPDVVNFRWLESVRPISFRSLLDAGFIDSDGYLTRLGRKADSLERIWEMGTGYGYRRLVRLGPKLSEVWRGSPPPRPAEESETSESSEEESELDYRLERIEEGEMEFEVGDDEDVVESIEVDYY